MTARTLPREPWRGSMICGYQTAYGMPWDRYCAERKGEGLPMCEEHFAQTVEEYGVFQTPPGVALGASRWAMRLLWEGVNPAVPVEATAEELELYAPILTGGA